MWSFSSLVNVGLAAAVIAEIKHRHIAGAVVAGSSCTRFGFNISA